MNTHTQSHCLSLTAYVFCPQLVFLAVILTFWLTFVGGQLTLTVLIPLALVSGLGQQKRKALAPMMTSPNLDVSSSFFMIFIRVKFGNDSGNGSAKFVYLCIIDKIWFKISLKGMMRQGAEQSPANHRIGGSIPDSSCQKPKCPLPFTSIILLVNKINLCWASENY